jgi:hypothetical protein
MRPQCETYANALRALRRRPLLDYEEGEAAGRVGGSERNDNWSRCLHEPWWKRDAVGVRSAGGLGWSRRSSIWRSGCEAVRRLESPERILRVGYSEGLQNSAVEDELRECLRQ